MGPADRAGSRGGDAETRDTPDETTNGHPESIGDRVTAFIDDVRVALPGLTLNGRKRTAEDIDPWPETPADVAELEVRRDVLREVVGYFQTASDLPAEPPETDFVDRGFFDFTYLLEHHELERYWVNKPFAFVSVIEDQKGQRRYHVTEPVLSEFEGYVLGELTKILRNSLMYQDLDEEDRLEEMFVRRARELIDQHTAALRPLSVHKLLYYLTRDFVHYDRIDPIMRDEGIEDISCDGADLPVFVYHRDYRDLETNITFGHDELRSFVARMAQRAGKHVSISNPLVDASLPDGSRVQLSFGGDVETRGPNFTVRQFSSVPETPVDLVKWGTFSIEQMAYFWLAIENNRSLIFAGGTGSGKTTSLNAVSFFIPKNSKVVSIEDTREITLPHDNWIQSLTRESASEGGSSVTMYDQLQTALRRRPEYLLVGEIRTQEQVALTFFQAMATGHTAYTTLHSESVTGVINRLENEPLGVPTQMIKELDIVSIQRQVQQAGDRVRRNDRVAEIIGGEGSDLRVNDIFNWDASQDSYNQHYDSKVVDDIADDRGWDRARLQQELDRREEVLRYLIDEDITWFEDVARVIHTFMTDQDRVLSAMRSEDLDVRDI